MTYYVSLYANSIKTKYGYILFNGMNGAIDEVDNYIGKAFENRDITEIENNLNKGEIEHLLKRGYLLTSAQRIKITPLSLERCLYFGCPN